MSAFDYAELFRHRGHKIVCVSYGQYNDPDNVAVECETCSEVTNATMRFALVSWYLLMV